MTSDRTNKWYHLYSNNPAVCPSDNQYADGYIMPDSYWKEQQRKEAEVSDDDDEY